MTPRAQQELTYGSLEPTRVVHTESDCAGCRSSRKSTSERFLSAVHAATRGVFPIRSRAMNLGETEAVGYRIVTSLTLQAPCSFQSVTRRGVGHRAPYVSTPERRALRAAPTWQVWESTSGARSRVSSRSRMLAMRDSFFECSEEDQRSFQSVHVFQLNDSGSGVVGGGGRGVAFRGTRTATSNLLHVESW